MHTHLNADASPFRDSTPGFVARRDRLLRKRRDELAVMPAVLHQVYSSRSARIAMLGALCLGSAATLVIAQMPASQDALATLLPGRSPSIVSTFFLATWLGAFLFYLIGMCAGQRRFAQAMSRCIRPGADLHHDVDRLCQDTPHDVGIVLSRRLEAASSALPVLAAGYAGPLTVAYVFLSLHSGGYPDPQELDRVASDFGPPFALVATAATLLALYLGFSRQRTRQRKLWGWVSALLMPVALCFWITNGSTGAALWTALALLATTSWLTLRRIASEQRDIEQGADSRTQLFDVRAVLRRARSFVARCLHTLHPSNVRRLVQGGMRRYWALRGRPWRFAVVTSSLLMLLCASVFAAHEARVVWIRTQFAETPAMHVDDDAVVPRPIVEPAMVSSMDSFGVREGALRLSGAIYPRSPVLLTGLQDMPALPNGWMAQVTVRLVGVQSGQPQTVFVNPFPGSDLVAPRQLTEQVPGATFVHANCSGDSMPLGLAVDPYSGWPEGGKYLELDYEVSLYLANCSE